jgi:hypothetical protein
MGIYLVGYDLRHKHISDYENLFAAIRAVSNGDWWHCLDSTWLIEHPGNATVIWNALVTHIHNASDKNIGDKLLVAAVQKDAQWTVSFNEQCHQWLASKLT